MGGELVGGKEVPPVRFEHQEGLSEEPTLGVRALEVEQGLAGLLGGLGFEERVGRAVDASTSASRGLFLNFLLST
jgi:hypothetical protein